MCDKLQRLSTTPALISRILMATGAVLWLASCNDAPSGQIGVTRVPAIRSTLSSPTDTPDPNALQVGVTINAPTATPLPTPTSTPVSFGLAARVNDAPITLEQYEAELRRYVAGQPNPPAFDSPEGQTLASQLKDTVIDALIEQTIIDQEALHRNIEVSDADINTELKTVKEKAGGETRYQAWLLANQQTDLDTRQQVRQELITSVLIKKVLADLPQKAEYIHAYHIVVASQFEAEEILRELQNGAQFEALAQSKSIDDSTRADGGDLDWFTRGAGAVLWTEVEDAAFALQPGETSPIVKSPIGYHIIRVTERATRDLTDTDRTYVQHEALRNWINQLKSNAKIEKYV